MADSRTDRALSGNKDGLRGWSLSGKLIAGDTKFHQLQANFDYVGYYTVQFSIEVPEVEFESGGIFALADITWTVEGNAITRKISIINGMTISGMGQSVNIKMSDFSSEDPTIIYNVACSVARGTRPLSGNIPNLSINTETLIPEADRRGQSASSVLLPGAARSWDVPPNVGVNSVFISVAPVASVANVYTSLRDMLLGQFELTTQNGVMIDSFNRWIPVLPGTSRVTLQLDAAFVSAAGVRVTPLWGIEG